MIPTLCTARLTLRPFRPDDIDAHAAIWADPRITAHVGGTVRTREESWLRMLGFEGHWRWFGFGFWAVEAQGRLIGNAGFQHFEREFKPALEAPEAGWAFSADEWGKGYATEAITAMLGWADVTRWPAVAAIIDPGNGASIHVARKVGFRLERMVQHRGEPIGVYTRLAGARAAA